MAVFEYIATDAAGKEFSGVYKDVDSERALGRELGKMGWSVVSAERVQKRFGAASRVKRNDVVTLAYELAGMCGAGLNFVKCLETYELQCEKGALKSIVEDVRRNIQAGGGMANSFGKYESVFGGFFVSMVEAGENSGKLGETLQIAAEFMEKQNDVRNKVRTAFAYPIIVSCLCLVIVSLIIVFVIPVFQKLYTQLNVQLPGPTLVLVWLSEVIWNYWWGVVPAIVGAVFAVKYLLKIKEVKDWIGCNKLKMPVVGKFNQLVMVSRYVRTFTMMVAADISIVDAIDMAKQVAGNPEMSRVSDEVKQKVMTGVGLSDAMSKFDIFPPMIVQLASSGEESGLVSEMLMKGVNYLDKNIDRTMRSLMVKIEPAMSVIMGLIVGGVLMGVYLPMFDYMSQIK